ncbi:Short-chain dehydrogenase TIC 32, chloroplastic [Seminavis robusta]|uniref:Short-chain dehydrogenase TIC 32, chloroplastic n=1 Tax=Seminavis robusta TaxID=568900 RepID=A0A9N8DJL2_9STRA|nr:Short-chain dehydrogenase TIC 32, chloroplastic [Seminavis robusta]|eukprot:Sro157_g071280.1 Short-chain dehydrogenase TIC 32, chloroplastic (349) ;mRNA; f:76119-77257
MTSRSGEADHGVSVENQWYDDWVKENIPDLSGKVAIVTGGNSGTGFWAASALAGKGCTVVLACRNEAKANAAKDEIIGYHPEAKMDVIVMDNMDLSTVKSFAETFNGKYDRLDFLLNNAGIMAQPLIKSKDGHDIQFQTNHLAHFLLTQLLWEKMLNTEGESRIVNHSSGAHKMGSPAFDKNNMENPSYSWGILGFNALLWHGMLPLMGMKPLDNWKRYGTSKLCNVLFTKELDRKIQEKSLAEKVICVACHPGYANTNLQNVAKDSMNNWEKMNSGNAQSAADGSLPLLLCTVGKDVKGGDYCEPSLATNFKGPPIVGKVGGNGNNAEMAKELWSYSEEILDTTFSV